MDENFLKEIIRICEILQRNSVRYMIVGGTAVGLHGYGRRSILISGKFADKHDIDFWYDPTYENLNNLLNALEAMGEDVSKERENPSPNPRNSFFKFELEEVTVDFLPQIPGIEKFHTAYANKGVVRVRNAEVNVIGYEELITNKEATGRKKDIDDIEELKKLK